MDRLFFDTNVLLDVLEQRAPWFPEAFVCLERVESGQAVGAMSALSLSDISYIQRSISTSALCAAFQKLRAFLEIAPLNSPVVDAALVLSLADFEDGLQLEAALAWKATHLLTRNTKDFPLSPSVKILTPSDYLFS